DAYCEALQLWIEECDLAKQERLRVGSVKPKLGKLEHPATKPGNNTGDGYIGDKGDQMDCDNRINEGIESDGGSYEE
ncbi:hypothetical protein PAXRUDRAFT_156447, partial [Paxillus rubicundulus Ve08.2h10]